MKATAVRPSLLTSFLDRLALDVQPRSAVIEATSRCQLRCPSCPTARGETDQALGRGYLSLARLTRILDSGRKLRHLELSNWGEAFLNPKLRDILRTTSERKVAVTLSNGVNLNHARDETLEALVKYQVRDITCSIDGASQESYVKYRKGGNFDRVISNIRKINEFKTKYSSKLPLLRWQFVMFGHNEHDVDKARQMARDLDMSLNFKLSWDADFSPVADRPLARRLTGAASRRETEDDHGFQPHSTACTQLWRKPAVNWDGKVIGCAVNYWGDFGDVERDGGFAGAVNSPRMKYARRMLMGRSAPRPDIPCTTCTLYKYRQRSRQWVTYADILLWMPLRDLLYRYGLTRAVRQVVVFRLPLLMRLPIVRRALLHGI